MYVTQITLGLRFTLRWFTTDSIQIIVFHIIFNARLFLTPQSAIHATFPLFFLAFMLLYRQLTRSREDKLLIKIVLEKLDIVMHEARISFNSATKKVSYNLSTS